jgi:hypothetical protein
MPRVEVVEFVKNNAKIHVNPDLATLASMSNNPACVVFHDALWREEVKGVAPQFWKLENGKVLPMTAAERNERRAAIESDGLHNTSPYDGYTPERVIEVVKEVVVDKVITVKEVVHSNKDRVIFFIIGCVVMLFSLKVMGLLNV